MSEWKEYFFSDLLIEPVRNGIYKKKEFHGSGQKIVNMGELFSNPRLFDIEMKRVQLNDGEKSRALLSKGDLIFARRSLTAEGAGKCSIIKEIKEDTTFESSLIRARPNKSISDSDFLYYYFSSDLGKNAMYSILRQVAVAGITGSDLMNLKLSIPPLHTQKAIAEILSSLDDKIELNNQINQNLEALAQALFKQWFVDFEFPNENGEPYKSSGGEMVDSELGEIPKGWIIDFLTKVLNVVYGKNLPTTNLTSFGFPVFGGNGIIGYYSKFHYENPQVLISCRGAASGKINFSKPQSFITNNSLVIEIPDGSNIPYGFLRQWSLNQDFTSFVSGSAQPQITIENLKPLQLLIPSKNILEEFKGSIEPLLIQKEELDRENFELKNLLDTLLPKLISGELEVNESLLESTF